MKGCATAPVGRLERLVDQTLERYRLLAEGEAVLVGVSGGPDSVALAHLLADRAPGLGLRLGIAHLHHGLRPEADADEAFVCRMAFDRGLPFFCRRADVRSRQRLHRLSLEEAARRVRYDFLEEVSARHGFAKIALGHHADDQAETLLLNLLRGSGRLGLAGIPPVRDGKLIRPLIMARRADIEAYIEARGIKTVADATNAEESFRRNRIRHRLIPTLERDYHPQVGSLLGRTGLILRDEEEWLESLTLPLFEEALAEADDGWVALDAAALNRMHVAAARRVLRRAIRQVKGNLRRLEFDHIERVAALTQHHGDAGPLYLPDRLRVWRRGAWIEIAAGEGRPPSRRTPPPADYAYTIFGCGALHIRETGEWLEVAVMSADALASPLSASPQLAFLDLESVRFPLTVRNFRPGDRFAPRGAAGTQKLKKYFSDHKIDRIERRRCPILLSEGRILWVAGHRLDGSGAVTASTRRVLRVERRLAKP
ncbi:MAG: tRNA lysidine(34) synthetase TilS [Desulfobacterales bacterium]|jgi:tRNA(Ile)-lysidine synthase|nr:tRNA lysidine(34) synthetase TilS [Desulfobacterales bacterium]